MKILEKLFNDKKSKVKSISKRIKFIEDLNSKTEFLPVFNKKSIFTGKKYILLTQKEYSRKSVDRVNYANIFKYYMDNNLNNTRTLVENISKNIDILNEYLKKVESFNEEPSDIEIESIGLSRKEFLEIENKIVSKLTYGKEVYEVTVNIECYYEGKNDDYYAPTGEANAERILELYNEWKNGKIFEANALFERKVVNDEIRYNVFKRDNFTCQLCGATRNDGAKLVVDHIMPVSRGGKTTMDNLQTLCERCNKGKSNKISSDYHNNMICPKCGSRLIIRTGSHGKFIGCQNFPRCKYTRDIEVK